MIEEAGPEQEEMEAGALAHVLFFNNHKSRYSTINIFVPQN